MRSEDYLQRSTNNWDRSGDNLFQDTSVMWTLRGYLSTLQEKLIKTEV